MIHVVSSNRGNEIVGNEFATTTRARRISARHNMMTKTFKTKQVITISATNIISF